MATPSSTTRARFRRLTVIYGLFDIVFFPLARVAVPAIPLVVDLVTLGLMVAAQVGITTALYLSESRIRRE